MEAPKVSIISDLSKTSKSSIRRSKRKLHVKRLSRNKGTDDASLLNYFHNNNNNWSLSSDVSVILPKIQPTKTENSKSKFVLKEIKPNLILKRKEFEMKKLPINGNFLRLLDRHNQCPMIFSAHTRNHEKESNTNNATKKLSYYTEFDYHDPQSSKNHYIYVNEKEEIDSSKRTSNKKRTKKRHSEPSKENFKLSHDNKRDRSPSSKFVPSVKDTLASEQVPLKESLISSIRNYKDRIISASKTESLSYKFKEPNKIITARFTISALQPPESNSKRERRKESLTSVNTSKKQMRERESFAKRDEVFSPKTGLHCNGYNGFPTNKYSKSQENKLFPDVRDFALCDPYQSETFTKSARTKTEKHYNNSLANSFEKRESDSSNNKNQQTDHKKDIKVDSKSRKMPLNKTLTKKDEVILNASEKSFSKLSEFLKQNDIINNQNVSSILLINKFPPKKKVSSSLPDREYSYCQTSREDGSLPSNEIRNNKPAPPSVRNTYIKEKSGVELPNKNHTMKLSTSEQAEAGESHYESEYCPSRTNIKKAVDKSSFNKQNEHPKASNKSTNKHASKNKLNYDHLANNSFEYDLIPHKDKPVNVNNKIKNHIKRQSELNIRPNVYNASRSSDKTDVCSRRSRQADGPMLELQEITHLPDSFFNINNTSSNINLANYVSSLEKQKYDNYSTKTTTNARNQQLSNVAQSEKSEYNDKRDEFEFMTPQIGQFTEYTNVEEFGIKNGTIQTQHVPKTQGGSFNQKNILESDLNHEEGAELFENNNKAINTSSIISSLDDFGFSEQSIKKYAHSLKSTSNLQLKPKRSQLVNVGTSVSSTRYKFEGDLKPKTPCSARSVAASVQTNLNYALPEFYRKNDLTCRHRSQNKIETEGPSKTNYSIGKILNNTNNEALIENVSKTVNNSSAIVSDPSQFFGKKPIFSDPSQFFIYKEDQEDTFSISTKELSVTENESDSYNSQGEVLTNHNLNYILDSEQPYRKTFQRSDSFSSKWYTNSENLTKEYQITERLPIVKNENLNSSKEIYYTENNSIDLLKSQWSSIHGIKTQNDISDGGSIEGRMNFETKSNNLMVSKGTYHSRSEISGNDGEQTLNVYLTESDKNTKNQETFMSISEPKNTDNSNSFVSKSKSFKSKVNDSAKPSNMISVFQSDMEPHEVVFKSKNIFMTELPSKTNVALAESSASTLVMSFKYSSLQLYQPSIASNENRDDQDEKQKSLFNGFSSSDSHKPLSFVSLNPPLKKSVEITTVKATRGDENEQSHMSSSEGKPLSPEKHKTFISKIKTPQEIYEVNKIKPMWNRSFQSSQESLLKDLVVIPEIANNLQKKDSINSKISVTYPNLLGNKEYIYKKDRLSDERVLPEEQDSKYSHDKTSVEANRHIETNSEKISNIANNDQSFQGVSLNSDSSELHSFSHILFNISVKDKGDNEAIRSHSNLNTPTSLKTSLILLPVDCYKRINSESNGRVKGKKTEELHESNGKLNSLRSERFTGGNESFNNKSDESGKENKTNKLLNSDLNRAQNLSSKNSKNRNDTQKSSSLLGKESPNKHETKSFSCKKEETSENEEKTPSVLTRKEIQSVNGKEEKGINNKDDPDAKSNTGTEKKVNKWKKMLKRKRGFGKINKMFMFGYLM